MIERTELIPVTIAARTFGVSEPTFRRRIREGVIPLFTDPRDKRRKLIRAADLDRLGTSQRLGPADVQGVA